MKFRPTFGPTTLLVSLVALLGCTSLAVAAPALAAPDAAAPAAAAAPRITAVRAAVAPETVSLTMEVSGEFTHQTVPSGDRLIFIDLPGAIPGLPSDSHLLNSTIVSSYRVVSYDREGIGNARLEVLLKKPCTVTANRTAGALQVKFVPVGTGAGSAAMAPSAVPTAARSVPAPKRSEPLRARGTIVESIHVARDDNAVRVQILTDGPVEYKSFQLSNPARLVLDIPATDSRAGNREVPVAAGPVRSVRIAQFSQSPKISRVVLDMERAVPFKVNPLPNMLEVEFAVPGGRTAMPERREKPVSAEASPAKAPAIAAPAPVVMDALASTVPAANAMPRLDSPATEPAPAPAAALAVPLAPMNVAAAMSAAQDQQSQTQPQTTQPQSPAPTTTVQPAPPQQGTTPPTAMPQQPAGAPAGPGVPAGPIAPRYTGEPISVNLKDVDLKDFFRLIHEISGLNIVLDPNVSGRVTIVLEDVPWDQALDIVLRNSQLDKQLEGNVLRIAQRITLRREEEERLALETAKQAAAERVTALRPLNYARAGELMATLTKFRSPRGEIIADERTNTLIITDIPQVIPTIDDVIRQLDRRALQVEIEARIVAASRSFSREVGAQFGFGTTAASRRTLFFGNAVGAAADNASPMRVTGLPEPITFESTRLPLFSNFPAAGATSGFSIIHRSPNAAIDFFISLAENRGIGKLLSRPRIITQNNVQGEVQQGVRIPVQTTVNNTISVQFINATLRLSVRPQVTNEGSIFLDISVENSAIDPGTPRINGVPALSTQLATTKVLVNDGNTVVFGGVLQNQNNLTIQQVPLLGSIPVIGNLFKRTGISTLTNELLFFVTPKIV